MTTAELRRNAQQAEAACDWANAATLWDAAADAYPMMSGRTSYGQLALLDIGKMRQRAADCRFSAAA